MNMCECSVIIGKNCVVSEPFRLWDEKIDAFTLCIFFKTFSVKKEKNKKKNLNIYIYGAKKIVENNDILIIYYIYKTDFPITEIIVIWVLKCMLTTLQFPTYKFDFHLLTTSVNVKFYNCYYILALITTS